MGESRYTPVRSPERSFDRGGLFEELPQVSIVSVCRQTGELRYTIELVYRQFKWTVYKKASQALLLHATVKTRAFLEDLKEKHDRFMEWLQKLQLAWDAQAHDAADQHEASISRTHSMSRDVPSAAALPVMRPTLGRLPSIGDRTITEMETYLDHFVKNLEILNSEAVCKFLSVSALSFAPEYGAKLKEGYVRVCHLEDKEQGWCSWLSCFCCGEKWIKVWAVLKPGFLAFLAHPFDPKPLDIIVFDVLSNNTEGQISLAKIERRRLHSGFVVTCGNRSVRVKTKGPRGATEWIASINDAGLRPPEGWCHPHRFGAFAPPRGLTGDDGSRAQWFIDGKSAFDAIATAISSAKSEIFIADWWFCPELYLRRPFALHESSRLDSLLGAKAREGVQIYVLLYKEVALALKINSLYTKRKLLGIHENIKVLRYPDHFSSGVYLWSHHEKLVIVDQRICFLGGLDLCFGRYDDPQHLLRDDMATIWPGKDYYNPRESEPNSWEDATKDEINRQVTPRMPWHDIQCAIWGPACRDVARHFVQRWNYAKRNKAPNEQTIPLLLPQHHMVIPHYLTGNEAEEAFIEAQEELRKASKPRSSTDDIPTLLPAVDAPEPTASEELRELLIDKSKHSKRFGRSRSSGSSVDLPLLNFVGSDTPESVKWYGANGSSEEWWEREENSPHSDGNEIGPIVKCNCQVVRSVGQWSAGTSQTEERSIEAAYCSLIDKAESFIYIENQFFISGLNGDPVIQNRVLESLYARILRAYTEKQCFRVIILLPLLPGFQGGVDDTGAASVRAIIHWQYRTICRGDSSLLKRLRNTLGDAVNDFVSFYGLRQHGKLKDDGPLVTSQIYVHSKILIVDDRVTLIGSANINDRSLLGSRDSEIAVVIEDKEFVTSLMNNTAYKAGRFTHGLRKSLWVEHLGLQASDADVIKDPICETTYKDVWMSRAELNTKLYHGIFECIPNDFIHTRTGLRQQVMSQREKKNGNIELGVTGVDLESPTLSSKVDGIRGHLVSFPLNFMCDEDLRPVFNESEYYASPQVYH